MLRWSPGAVRATVGIGGLGLMCLLLPLFDGFGVRLPYPAIFALAFGPMILFVLTDDLIGALWSRRAQGLAIAWYGIAALAAIVSALGRGVARHDLLFLAFVAVGAWPCVVAARGLYGRPRSTLSPSRLLEFHARYGPGERTVVLEGVARRTLFLLGISTLFVGFGLTPGFRHDSPVAAWFGVVFFGLGGLLALARLLHPAARGSLRLDPRGFEVVTFGRRHLFRWSDVTGFGLVKLHGTPMISLAYAPEYTGQRVARRAVAGLSGIEGAILDTYEVSGVELVALLEAWRTRFGGRSEPAPALDVV